MSGIDSSPCGLETIEAVRSGRLGAVLQRRGRNLVMDRGAWLASLIAVLLMVPDHALAQSQAPLGELEEPGEMERAPIEGEARSAEAPSDTASQAGPDNRDEEVTERAGDEGSVDGSSDEVAVNSDPLEDDSELHEDEAIEILPDSEAVDETIEQTDEPEEAEEAEKPEEGEKPGKPTDEEAAQEEPSAPREPEWRIRWQNAFIVERVDNPSYQFLFGGRVHNDWGAYVPSDDIEDDFGGNGTGVKFRRARIYFQGQFFRYGFFKVEYDFSNQEENEFVDVYGGLSLPGIGLVRVGHFKEPISLEFLNSSNFRSFNELPGIQAFSPVRNTGFMLNGNFLTRGSTYSIGFFRRTDGVGEGFSNNEDYRLTSRITAMPYYRDGGRRLLHLELGFSHQFADSSEGTRYAYPAGSEFAPNLVDTGILPVNDVELLNVGVAVVEGSLSFQGEVMLAAPHDGISEDPVFWGTYGQVSWWLTGERRRYLRGRGVFSRVVPQKRFDPEKGEWGAIELAARFSWLDLSNDGIRGGTLAEGTLALNWVLFSNFRMSNNYVLSHTGDRPVTRSGFTHTWVTRFMIDF